MAKQHACLPCEPCSLEQAGHALHGSYVSSLCGKRHFHVAVSWLLAFPAALSQV